MSRALLLIVLATSARAALMPLPWKITAGTGSLSVGPGFRLVNSGCPDSAVARFQSLVARQTRATRNHPSSELTVACLSPGPLWPTHRIT